MLGSDYYSGGNVRRWLHWLLATDSATDKPMHMCSYTLDEYPRVDGKWLFAKVEVAPKFMVAFDEPFSSGKPA